MDFGRATAPADAKRLPPLFTVRGTVSLDGGGIDAVLVMRAYDGRQLQEHLDDYTEQKVTLKMKYDSSQLTQEDFGVVLSSVKGVLRNPYGLWKEGNLETKQLVQQLAFPNRLIYEQIARKFRKPEKALVYCVIEEFSAQKAGLVGLAGLEPATKPL